MANCTYRLWTFETADDSRRSGKLYFRYPSIATSKGVDVLDWHLALVAMLRPWLADLTPSYTRIISTVSTSAFCLTCSPLYDGALPRGLLDLLYSVGERSQPQQHTWQRNDVHRPSIQVSNLPCSNSISHEYLRDTFPYQGCSHGLASLVKDFDDTSITSIRSVL